MHTTGFLCVGKGRQEHMSKFASCRHMQAAKCTRGMCSIEPWLKECPTSASSANRDLANPKMWEDY